MLQATAVGEGRREREKDEIAPWHKGVGEAIIPHGDFDVLGEARVRDLFESIDPNRMVFSDPTCPLGKLTGKAVANRFAALKFDNVPLTVIIPHCLNGLEPI
ncbi:hypothetical protein MAE02_03080 [Microvirga aerophila]|uniref:Uncharacterized protein n=1 Tax=Microvirga aerophila TaxID=670291 RepID=A0A512BKW2_9HYPH|nr:hypothetical protein MAE02_03080 [Microvirga aerophila]